MPVVNWLYNMSQINYIRQDGVVKGIDFDGRFRVKRWPAVAVVAMGYFAEYPEPSEEDQEPELMSDESRIVVVMVGDDKRHIVAASDLIPLNEDEFCPECGQIGCGHGRP